uniref:Putative fimbrial protein n=1 Tax=termite gut metagenome TaxID=433724 RepID=S0DET5_9ZZZZ
MVMMSNLKLTALGALVIGTVLTSTAVNADPVTLNITGNVVASPCQIASDSVTKNVNLGSTIQASDLQTAASGSSWVNFTIDLVSCPAGTTSATMTMHGTADTNSTGDLYKNTGTATNLAVQLQTQAGGQMGDGKTLSGTLANNAYSYTMRARAYSTSGGVKPGTVSSVVTATFVYQ